MKKLQLQLQWLLNCLVVLLYFVCVRAEDDTASSTTTATSIIFTTLGKPDYSFDIFTLPASVSASASHEIRITDSDSVNFNGHFPSQSPSLLHRDFNQTQTPSLQLIYVTERNGSSNIYYDALYYSSPEPDPLQPRLRLQQPLLQEDNPIISMKDRPTLTADDFLIYVSTHEDPHQPRTSWAAVYSTDLTTGITRRLTPPRIADFSPAVSPSGLYTAVASYGLNGWQGEVEDLTTDIYVFLTRDGTQRVKVVEDGGWPCWVDDFTLFFHRRSQDNWISVYKATLPQIGPFSTDSVTIQRVTPPGLHAFTPATSPGNDEFIAVATRRPDSSYRHIELFDLVNNEFTELTRLVSPNTHHFNPFISPDSVRVGYHRCRGGRNTHLLLENVHSPSPDISLFRVDGSFPSFSPAGDRIAYVDFPGVYVVNLDGSHRKEVYPKTAFSTAWNPVHDEIVYTSTGPTFASESTSVDIISINVDNVDGNGVKKLTTDGENNAFPSVSPDGKWVVFRSGRTGHKNLYIMDAMEGEKAGLYQLTEGPWSDTMCSWSPDGDWIAFASDRHDPGSGSFELYLIHPNGTGLRKLVESGSAGRANHPSFSPDGKRLVFTSDYSGISAEPISSSHHYQPYGEIFTINLDGSDLKRLTHNSYEDGTPAWGRKNMRPVDVKWGKNEECAFEDCHWLNKMPPEYGIWVQPFGYEPTTKPRCAA